MLRFIPVLAIAVALYAGAVHSEDALPGPVDPSAVRCKSIRKVGTRIPEKMCKSNAEWKREEEEIRASAEERQRNRRCTGGSSC